MSCGKDAEHCKQIASVSGAPESVAMWSEGRGAGGHCPDCGGFLTTEGVCNNDHSCGTFAMAMGASMTIVRAGSEHKTKNGVCPDCGATLSVVPGEEDWCMQCEDLVDAIEYTPPTLSDTANPTGGLPTIVEYADTARALQDALPGKDRVLTQEKLKSVGYNKVKLALRSVGVPGVDPKKEAVITNMVWQYLDRCPHCKAWISPKTGVCKNPRCKSCNTKVGEIRGWNPQRVRWVNNASQVGKVLHPASTATKSSTPSSPKTTKPKPKLPPATPYKAPYGTVNIATMKDSEGWHSMRENKDTVGLWVGPYKTEKEAIDAQLRGDYKYRAIQRASLFAPEVAEYIENDPDLSKLITLSTTPEKYADEIAELYGYLKTPSGDNITPNFIENYMAQVKATFESDYEGDVPDGLLDGKLDVTAIESGDTPKQYIQHYADDNEIDLKRKPYAPVYFDTPPSRTELQNILKPMLDGSDTPYAGQRVVVTFDAPVSLYGMPGKRPREKFELTLMESNKGEVIYSFRKGGRSGWTPNMLLSPSGGKLLSVKAVSPTERKTKQRKTAQSLAHSIHPNIWRKMKREIQKTPDSYIGRSLGRVNIKRVFKRGDWVVKQLQKALDEGEPFEYSEYGPKRDKSVAVERGDDGELRAWFSSRFSEQLNGDYYILLNAHTASFGERD